MNTNTNGVSAMSAELCPLPPCYFTHPFGRELWNDEQMHSYAAAAVAAERERCAAILDADADKQEAEWRAHLASGKGGPATSLHTIPRAYAARLRGHNTGNDRAGLPAGQVD
jgi:hypothetical protein